MHSARQYTDDSDAFSATSNTKTSSIAYCMAHFPALPVIVLFSCP